jgi:hypothetical protein
MPRKSYSYGAVENKEDDIAKIPEVFLDEEYDDVHERKKFNGMRSAHTKHFHMETLFKNLILKVKKKSNNYERMH